jgi:trimethylamine--corrinoid protein Co-methyltransferase
MDIIHELGPGGAYITHEQNFQHMRSQSRTELFDRHSRGDWMDVTQGKCIRDRAYAKAIEILETHEPYPLPDNASETMKEIVNDYEMELNKNKNV